MFIFANVNPLDVPKELTVKSKLDCVVNVLDAAVGVDVAADGHKPGAPDE